MSCVQAVILEGHLLRAITWTPEIVAAFLGFNACLFALYTLTPVLLQRADATVLNLSLLTSDHLRRPSPRGQS